LHSVSTLVAAVDSNLIQQRLENCAKAAVGFIFQGYAGSRRTHATGGTMLRSVIRSDLRLAFKTIEKLLRSQYTPPAFMADESFHTVEIVLANPKLKVRCRRGYYAIFI
jgi:hypothetical protein